jgi:hypothetical protein
MNNITSIIFAPSLTRPIDRLPAMRVLCRFVSHALSLMSTALARLCLEKNGKETVATPSWKVESKPHDEKTKKKKRRGEKTNDFHTERPANR